MDFVLHEQLARDSFFIKDLGLTQLRLIDNANYPWVIMVPRINYIIEILDLSQDQYLMLNQEVFFISKIMQELFLPDKLNLATIGNKVSQLHYHIVVRYKSDKCFPQPVWGQEQLVYDSRVANQMIDKIRQKL